MGAEKISKEETPESRVNVASICISKLFGQNNLTSSLSNQIFLQIMVKCAI